MKYEYEHIYLLILDKYECAGHALVATRPKRYDYDPLFTLDQQP